MGTPAIESTRSRSSRSSGPGSTGGQGGSVEPDSRSFIVYFR